jgi:hypothetical protein
MIFWVLLLIVIIHFAIQSRQADTAALTGCRRSSVVTVQQKLRGIACQSASTNNTVLGGAGRIVEMEESQYIKVKHHREKDLRDNQSGSSGCMNVS